jgi:hypothetical protein
MPSMQQVSIPWGYRAGGVGASLPRWPTTGQVMGQGMQILRISPDFFNALENRIRWELALTGRMKVGMDILVRFMAYANLSYAQKYALGPVDPEQQRPELAWRIPVRRITGRYFFGWKVRRRGIGHYELRNDSREAFFIEFGIHRNPQTGLVATRRQRRPILKLSLMRTLRYMEKTQVNHRIWASLYMPPPGKRHGKGFLWQMQGGHITFGGDLGGMRAATGLYQASGMQ